MAFQNGRTVSMSMASMADRTGRTYEGRDLPGHVDVEVGQGDDDVRGERYMEPVAAADIELKMMPGSFSSGDDL